MGVAVGKQFVDAFPDRVYKSASMSMMLEDGRAGKLCCHRIMFLCTFVVTGKI